MSVANELLTFKDNVKHCNTLIYNEDGAAEPVGDGEFKYTKLSEFMKELLKRDKNTIDFQELKAGFKQLFLTNPLWDDFDLRGIIKTAMEYKNTELLKSYYDLSFEYFNGFSTNFHDSLDMLLLSKKFLGDGVFKNEVDLYIKEIYCNYDVNSSQKSIDLNRVTEGLIKDVTSSGNAELAFCEEVFSAMIDNAELVYESILHIKQSIEEVYGEHSFSMLCDYAYCRTIKVPINKINEMIDDEIINLKTRISNSENGGFTVFDMLRKYSENKVDNLHNGELHEKIYQRKNDLIQNMINQIITLEKNEKLGNLGGMNVSSSYVIPFVGVMENKELNENEIKVVKILFKNSLAKNHLLDVIVPFVFSSKKNGPLYNQIFNEEEKKDYINQIIQYLDDEFTEILQSVIMDDSFYTRGFRDSLKTYHSLAKYFMSNIESEKQYSKTLDIIDTTIKKTFNVNKKMNSDMEDESAQLITEINIMREDVKMRKEIQMVPESVTKNIKKIKM